MSTENLMAEASREEWVVRFLNLPSIQQVDFLYRSYLNESIRSELEDLVFPNKTIDDKKRGD